jgi:hypothetical protein
MKIISGQDYLRIEGSQLVWLGDPCYAPELNTHEKNNPWDDFCNELFDDERYKLDENGFVMEHNGTKFFFCNTAHGDGCYRVSSGGECGVDAGMLSVIPAGAFGLDPSSGDNYGGVFTTVSGLCHVDENSTLHAGIVTIVTEYECDCCGGIDGECSCERCYDCGEWEDYCNCQEEEEEEEEY